MHIMEGYLPAPHAIGWSLASGSILAYCGWSVGRSLRARPQDKFLLSASAAYMFTLSALKLPSITGSCSHPTGVGLGAVLFGWRPMVLIGAIVLLFQALLLAHGGLTTLGANLFAMGIAGATGTDDQAKDAIEDLRPGYVPWFSPIWKPPSDEVETLLFTLQAALGAGVLGYVIGNLQGRAARAGRVDGRG